ncbi:hypothetical protein Tco_0445799 [Tanacetum coccineum]
MLESKAYQTYHAFASREKAPKPKYIRKKADLDTSPKKKTIQATKGTRLKSKAKLATKRSKNQFHSSHASGSSDGVDTQSKVLDEKQQKVTGTNEGAGVIPEVPDVPKYDLEREEESWRFSQDDKDAEVESNKNDDSEETESDNDGDNLTYPNLSTYKAKDQEEEKEADEEEEEEEKADDEDASSE